MFRIVVLLGLLFFYAITSDVAFADRRVAVVIGNEAYSERPIDNPASDASIVAAALKKIGFELVEDNSLTNLDKDTMQQTIEKFGRLAKDADYALFYYSGHGIQFGGTNYLIPIDLGLKTSAAVWLNTIPVSSILEAMNKSKAHLKILFLDACRTPFIKNLNAGYAPMEAPEGTIIGYATQPNTPAWSGMTGGNSPYAEALAMYLPVKGLSLFAMLNNVGLYVMDKTNRIQRPSVQNSPIAGSVDSIYIAGILETGAVQKVGSTTPNVPQPSSSVKMGESLGLIQSAYNQLGKNDYVGARATLTEAIEKSSTSATPYSYRGFAWYQEGGTKKPKEALEAYKRAIEDLNKAIQLDPNYAPAFRHRGNTKIAAFQARKAMGDQADGYLDEGINDLRTAAELDSGSKTNANDLGRGYLLKRSYRDAIDSFNAAIKLDASFAAPYVGLCETYRNLGDWTLAGKNAALAADRDSDQRSKPCLRTSTISSTSTPKSKVTPRMKVTPRISTARQPYNDLIIRPQLY